MNDASTPTPHQQLAPNELGAVSTLGSTQESSHRTDGADIIASISRRLAEKGAPTRLGPRQSGAVALLDGQALTSGTTGEVIEQWLAMFDSAEHLWDAAAQLWRGGFSTPATALALAALEEVAKLAAEGLRVAAAQPHTPAVRNRRRPLPDQDNKVLVTVHGALANGRINRQLGAVRVSDFLGLVERGELAELRHSCLHAGRGLSGISVPRGAVTRERAAWIVALAGEVLAEIHFEPGEWGRVLAKVDAFEHGAGLQTQESDEVPLAPRWTAPPAPASPS